MTPALPPATHPLDQTAALTALSALSHPLRLSLVRLLVGSAEGMAAGAIAQALAVSASALSFHLANLEQAGLLRSERRARQIIYSADRTALGGLIRYLLDDCCCADPVVHACCRDSRTTD